MELYRPSRETTVVDVGVTDAPFGEGSSDNFFEALYPWPEQITAVGHTEFPGYAGVFNVTANSILLAHQTGDYTSNQSELVYLDISDPAGAMVDPTTLERARGLGLDPAHFLADNDSTGFFSRLGDLVETGPTWTNVNDFRAIVVDRP